MSGASGVPGRIGRQVDCKRGAAPDRGLRPRSCRRAPRRRRARWQAQAGAAPRLLGADPRLEDARQQVVGNAVAGVGDLDAHAIRRAVATRTSSVAALRHRVDGVGHQVEQRQLQVGRVDENRRVAGRRVDVERDAGAPPDLDASLRRRGCTSAPAVVRVLRPIRPRTIEQRANRRRHLRDLFLDDGQPRAVRESRPELLFQQLHVAGNQIQRRADLMRDVGGRLADRGELLGAGELLAQPKEPLVRLDQLLVALLHFHRRFVAPAPAASR